MFDENNNKMKGDPKKPTGGGGFQINAATVLVWIGIIGAIVAVCMLKTRFGQTPPVVLKQADFLQKFDAKLIDHAYINLGGQASLLMPVTGTFFETNNTGAI